MCNKAVDNYSRAFEFVPELEFECYMTQEICDKFVNTCPSTIKFVPECFMNEQMSDKAATRCF